MCSLCPREAISADPAQLLHDEVSALRKDLKHEQQKNIELESICRDLNQDNDKYLEIALQLEEAVGKLLVALSLPTNALYQTNVTNYNALLNLIDDETPRLTTLMSGLNLLASLVLGLNSSIEMHKGQIRSLQEDVSRLEGEKSCVNSGDAILHRLPNSPLEALRNADRYTATCVDDSEGSITTGMNQDSVSAVYEGSTVVIPVPSNQASSGTDHDSQPLKEPNMSKEFRCIKSGAEKVQGGQNRVPRKSNQPEPAAFYIFDGITDPDTLSDGYKCAISVDGDRLAGDPFRYQTGWQIHFNSYAGLGNPHITLMFRLTRAKFGKPGNVQAVKGFKLVWQLSLEDSFNIREVKAYKPASLGRLPLSLSKLCTDKHVSGTLWLVSIVGMFDSPPDYSRRVLEDLDENTKFNIKALFTPGSAKQVDIWFVNPKDDRRKRKLDMGALINLRNLH